MKSIVMPGTVQLNEQDKEQLTQEVKETLATGGTVKGNTTITSAQVWNLQRNRRSASDMIRRWNLN